MRLDMPCVETAHLLLRPVEEGDVCDMFTYYSDPLVMRYLSLHPHTDIEETLNSIQLFSDLGKARCTAGLGDGT